MKHYRIYLLCLALLCGVSRADSDKHKSGLEVESFGGNGYITNGFMLGLRSLHYFDAAPHVNYGYEVVAGSARGERLDIDNLTYGGLCANYESSIGKVLFYEVGAMLGFGFGREDALGFAGHSVVIKPEIALGLSMIEGYRASFGVGYLMMPEVTGFNALSFTVRLEHVSTGNEAPY